MYSQRGDITTKEVKTDYWKTKKTYLMDKTQIYVKVKNEYTVCSIEISWGMVINKTAKKTSWDNNGKKNKKKLI